MNIYLQETEMLNYGHPSIQRLIREKQWTDSAEKDQIRNIYDFVHDGILFGYNAEDTIPASAILQDGYGQCNTKATLFMALLRAVGIPCRLHGFTIDKRLQRGAMTGIVYAFAPRDIVHSWVEVQYGDRWYAMEGLILDSAYLKKLQEKFSGCKAGFCGYGVATDDFQHPPVAWNANDTYIQKEGINHDLGVFHSPDVFFKQHSQRLTPLKRWIFQNYGCKSMNRNVAKIRASLV